MSRIRIRPARREDAPTIAALIRALAAYERLEHEVRATAADIERDGFGEPARFECLLAELDGEPVGFALFFPNYSTFEGTAGLFLEDLFVAEHARGHGIGRRLMARLAAIAVERGCPRLDFQVLDWNPARAFYDRIGANEMTEWRPRRLEGAALTRLAAADA